MSDTPEFPEPDLRGWMDRMKLKGPQVAQQLGISLQTLHNWRSAGIPPRKRTQVARLMADWDKIESSLNTLQIRASAEQFTRWNWAALNQGKLIEEWAREGLDEFARECFSMQTAAVAEDAHPYGVIKSCDRNPKP